MDNIHQILKQYWGYSDFRPLQEDIIQSVLAGNDTLALLPTGGGKSICFQVPALAREGVCIVISPLIALMKDQVEQLKKRGIPAAAIYSGMHKRDIDIQVDNCIYGNTRFLYVSPERLRSESFVENVQHMNVSLLAIDEAHCISQWGYDFRPPYLQIAEFRNYLPKDTPVIALTATATPVVREDIIKKLELRNCKLFQKSFSRKNLSYVAYQLENKMERLLEILHKVEGTAVVYVRSRKRTKEIADYLLKKNISADYYHAGLTNAVRASKQDNWINNKTRVIVATNAFGMGIDKPNVRTVIHIDLPDTLEAYYQEAGRAGRDEKNAFAVVLYNKHDIEQLKERAEQSNPPVEEIRRVYQALANYFQLAVGSGYLCNFDFDVDHFCKVFSLPVFSTYTCLKRLENEGFIQLTEAFYKPSKLFLDISPQKLYEYQLANKKHDSFVKLLLRMYGGELYTNFVTINEARIAREYNLPVEKIKELLLQLQRQTVCVYEQQTDKPQILFTTSRFDASKLPIEVKKLEQFKVLSLQKSEAVANYLLQTSRCRTQMLLEYFGEITDDTCGVCDYCIQQKKLHEADEDELRKKIKKLLQTPQTPEALAASFKSTLRPYVIQLIRLMLDMGELTYNDKQELVSK